MILIGQGATAVTEARGLLAAAAAAAAQLHDHGIESAAVRLYLASDVLLPYGDSEEAVQEVARTQERIEDATGHLKQSALLHHQAGDNAAAAVGLRELASIQAAQRGGAVPLPEQILRTALNLAREARAAGVEQQILEDLAALAGGRQVSVWRAQALAAARRAEPIQLVVGQDIVEPFDPASDGIGLIEIARVRRELQEDDLTLPVVRVTDDPSLPRREYAIYFWGERVYQGLVPGDAARELAPDQLSGSADVTDEPGYLGRIEWIRSRRTRGEPGEAPLIDPATVAATNLKQLARRHRDLVTADRPPGVSYPLVEAMSLEELLGQF